MLPTVFLTLAALLLLLAVTASGQPLRLHPDNPHYFLFRGEPTVLITSGEHYGAVLNLDFDYRTYLDTLAAAGLNHTRTFVGAYCEHPGAFNIARNTLAPAAGRFICPWARSDRPGYPNGGNRFDLSRWDPAYFERLRGFVSHASERGIVVEVNLFCPFYGDGQWALSPMNAANNINRLGNVPRQSVYSLDTNGGLLPVQDDMTRRIVEELRDFDNVYYEIMNEPYAGSVPEAWQRHITDVIWATEEGLPHRHLISQNIANGQAAVQDPHPAVSILNFHYAWPPETVALNYHLGRAIGDNETGFKGTADRHYRMEGWAFILAGGALYSHLDYSFTVGHENGTFAYPPQQPGGGGTALRRQLGTLASFMRRFDFVRMAPDPSIAGDLPPGLSAQALVEPGRQYAVYLYRPEAPGEASAVSLAFELPAGTYEVGWLDPLTGEAPVGTRLNHAGGRVTLGSPAFSDDMALTILVEG